MIRVTHDGELDCSTCDRNVNARYSSGGGRHPSGCARVDDNDDDDDDDGGDNEDDEDDHEDAANDGDGDNDDKNDVNDER